MKRVAILGSTGSIGRSTLSVAESYPERFQIVTLAAGSNLDAAFEQAMRWRPRVISMAAEADADALRSRLEKEGLSQIEVVHGQENVGCLQNVLRRDGRRIYARFGETQSYLASRVVKAALPQKDLGDGQSHAEAIALRSIQSSSETLHSRIAIAQRQ